MPSPATLAEKGLAAFNASRYPEAIDLYTQALQQSPESPDYYLKRSTAYQRSAQYASALQDAELAVMLADKRGKRELVGSAQLRRGIALYLLGQYGDANFCFDAAEKRCSDKEKNMLGIWRSKVQTALAAKDEDDVSREVTIVEIPRVTVPKQTVAAPATSEAGTDTKKVPGGTPAPTQAPVPAPPVGVITPPSKIRHEWYQTNTDVVLTLYVKNAPKGQTTVEIEDRSLSISFPLPTGSDFTFDVDPLFDRVVSSNASHAVLSTKIEVKLPKATPGRKWADLEGSAKDNQAAAASTTTTTTAAAPTRTGTAAPGASEGPSYPTSSKKGPKDWDKVAKELTAKKKKKKDSKAEGTAQGDGDGDDDEDDDYGSDYDGGDPASYFFKKLYKDADEDTRRAMMKSYTESNGTALSTNWAEVSKGKVETSAPDGMVAKKWEDE